MGDKIQTLFARVDINDKPHDSTQGQLSVPVSVSGLLAGAWVTQMTITEHLTPARGWKDKALGLHAWSSLHSVQVTRKVRETPFPRRLSPFT